MLTVKITGKEKVEIRDVPVPVPGDGRY